MAPWGRWCPLKTYSQISPTQPVNPPTNGTLVSLSHHRPSPYWETVNTRPAHNTSSNASMTYTASRAPYDCHHTRTWIPMMYLMVMEPCTGTNGEDPGLAQGISVCKIFPDIFFTNIWQGDKTLKLQRQALDKLYLSCFLDH